MGVDMIANAETAPLWVEIIRSATPYPVVFRSVSTAEIANLRRSVEDQYKLREGVDKIMLQEGEEAPEETRNKLTYTLDGVDFTVRRGNRQTHVDLRYADYDLPFWVSLFDQIDAIVTQDPLMQAPRAITKVELFVGDYPTNVKEYAAELPFPTNTEQGQLIEVPSFTATLIGTFAHGYRNYRGIR